jgi:hypothetical protein
MSVISVYSKCACGAELTVTATYKSEVDNVIAPWRIDHHECLKPSVMTERERTIEENVMEIRASLGELWRWKCQMTEAKLAEAFAYVDEHFLEGNENVAALRQIFTRPDTFA